MSKNKIKAEKSFLLPLFISGLLFAFAYCFFLSLPSAWAEEAEVDEEEVEETEEEIDDVKDEIKDLEKEKQVEEQKKLQIGSDIAVLNNNIDVIESELEETETEIEKITREIESNNLEIERKKTIIAETLRRINQTNIEAHLILMNEMNNYTLYFSILDELESFEEKLAGAIDGLEKEKQKKEKHKEEQEKTFELHDDQKNTLQAEKNKKAVLYNQSQQKVSQKEASIGELNAKLSKLKSELSSLLGEGYDAKDIKDAAKFASKATGVDRDFLMGMLVVESDLGRYTGGCDYKESRMSSYRKGLFKDICKELDYNYKKMKVSCPPANYSGTGGAMGVAQFMSDTWMGYKNSIAAATGHNPPDPWSLTDGVTAMALKLAKVPGVTSGKSSAECNAAKLYLSGTTSSTYDWYCDKVEYWADNYEKVL